MAPVLLPEHIREAAREGAREGTYEAVSQSGLAFRQGPNRRAKPGHGPPPQRLRLLAEQVTRVMPDGRSAPFRCPEQAALLDHLVFGDRDLLGIIRTGGGKSEAVLLWAKLCPTKLAVVFAPLNALISDLVQRATAMGVQARWWKRGEQLLGSPEVGLVFVNIETAVTDPSFRTFLEIRAAAGSLEWMILDEAHFRIYWSNFRAAFSCLPHLRHEGVSEGLALSYPP
jgi:superfamily II DNA helicase RecQ